MPEDQRPAYSGSVEAVSPARRVGKLDDVADAVGYLAGACDVSGTVLECIGGYSLSAAALAS